MMNLDELKEMLEKITPEPWLGDMHNGQVKYEIKGGNGELVLRVNHKDGEFGFVGDNGINDADFVLKARTAIPVLIRVIENLIQDERYWIKGNVLVKQINDRIAEAEREIKEGK